MLEDAFRNVSLLSVSRFRLIYDKAKFLSQSLVNLFQIRLPTQIRLENLHVDLSQSKTLSAQIPSNEANK